jgi:acetoacetyl-CoA synthetase
MEPLWKPSDERIRRANITRFMAAVRRDYGVAVEDYASLYCWSIDQPVQFWNALWDFAGIIADTRGQGTLTDGDRMPGARWFPEARLNFAENLLRRPDDQEAIVFCSEQGVRRTLSYRTLTRQVASLAQAFRGIGVTQGDRIAAILPNMPEAVIGMLASASIGAIWSSCSPDFEVTAVVDRFVQIQPKVLLAVDGYDYNGKTYHIADRFDRLLEAMPSIAQLIVVPHIESASSPSHGKAVLWVDFVAGQDPESMRYQPLPFDHPLYILFSSGTTGPPKCIVHGAGGTLLQHRKEHLLHADVHPGDRLFYFTTCGWMMWNWLVSGLASKATLILYDGSPFYPDERALVDLIDAAGINIFGVSAKYLDALKKSGLKPKRTHDLETLDTILSTGSPLAPESFDFLYRDVKSDVLLASISGGTDIVGCFVIGTPILPVWRGEIQCRALGMKVEVFDEQGRSLRGEKGELVCTAPFPSMPVGFWNDPDGRKYHAAYFERYPNAWHHGDYVALTEHDGMIIYGRSDAVLNPGGVRIGTAEIYRQVEQIDEVLESVAIAQHWQSDVRVVLFVRLRNGLTLEQRIIDAIRRQIRTNTSPRHVPARIAQVSDIPRTRSGKIAELAVRDVVHGRPVRNTEALANPEALALFRDLPELRT